MPTQVIRLSNDATGVLWVMKAKSSICQGYVGPIMLRYCYVNRHACESVFRDAGTVGTILPNIHMRAGGDYKTIVPTVPIVPKIFITTLGNIRKIPEFLNFPHISSGSYKTVNKWIRFLIRIFTDKI